MKKNFIYIISLSLAFTVLSCADRFEEINTPSNAVTEANPAFFFEGMIQIPLSNYQRNINLYADFYAQYFANTIGGFPSPRYDYVDGWVGNKWREHYTNYLRRYHAINEAYKDDSVYSDAIAICEIFTCYQWSRMTDYYGDIPYFDAGLGESAKYDTQEKIYLDLLQRLEAAVDTLSGEDGKYVFDPGYDLLYNADVEQWKKLGNSLRLRLGMRLSNVAPATAQSAVASAVAAGVMTSNVDVARLPVWRPGFHDYLSKMLWDWDNARVSKTFTDYLYNQSSVGEDPRTPLWLTYKRDNEAVTREDIGEVKYVGLENGYSGTTLPVNRNDKATINLEGEYVDFNGPDEVLMYFPVMFYSEVLFLQAEAALRGWIAGDANTLYKEGIQASMDYVGVDATDAQAYIDGIADLTGSNEAQLKSIITQKWIANFPNGEEGWADFRRTDYPDITLPIDGVSGNSSVAANTYVKRIRYPDNQHELNEVSMPSALNSYNSDRMDIKLWWDVKGTEEKGANDLMDSNF